MFAISTKVKLAAGIAAGALALGAAGAYAAQNLPQTINSPVISQLGGNGAPQLNLVSLNGAKQLTNPKSLPTNPGECVSFFATNRNYALLPSDYVIGSNKPLTISKANYHGKLMSGLNAWCKAEIKAVSTTTTTTTTANQTATTDTTQSNDTQSGPPQGHGHGHGHGKPAFATN
jgi:hypothetical protein